MALLSADNYRDGAIVSEIMGNFNGSFSEGEEE